MKNLIATILRKQATRYIGKNKPKIIAICGSAGKTSTTQAIATVLEEQYKLRKTIKNYNTDLGVPCSIFNRNFPENLYNPFAWLLIFIKNEIQLLKNSSTEIMVLELGTDKPGEIAEFAWLKPDIAVVTCISPEHMEFFHTIENVAKEEISVIKYSDKVFINDKMVDKKYLTAYSEEASKISFFNDSNLAKNKIDKNTLNVIGKQSIQSISAAIAVASELGMDKSLIRTAVTKVKPQPGRTNLLEGIKVTTLIDDSYNSSPITVTAALDYLYSCKAPQRIALIGNMNELGDTSRQAHIMIGEYCNPDKLDLVITLGEDANKYTSLSARASGCRVIESDSPYQAASLIEKELKEGAYVLFKGSQNGVFAEEAVKMLLKNPEDSDKLVRQSVFWKIKKIQTFKDAPTK